MMTYATSRATAIRLLAKFGQAVTQRTYPVGTYDTSTGRVGSNTPVDYTVKGAIFDFGAGQTLERGTLIQGGDKRLLVDPSRDISPQDHFIVGGVEYVIVSIGEVSPAGTRVLYDLHLRT